MPTKPELQAEVERLKKQLKELDGVEEECSRLRDHVNNLQADNAVLSRRVVELEKFEKQAATERNRRLKAERWLGLTQQYADVVREMQLEAAAD